MNLKQGYKIVDSRKGGEVRKKTDKVKITDSSMYDEMYKAWLRVDTALREMEQGKSYFEEKVYLDKGMGDLFKYIGELETSGADVKSLYKGWSRLDAALREMEQGKSYFEEKIYLDRALMELMDGIVRFDRMANDSGFVGDSARVNDMAIRDMAVRGRGAIDRKQEGEFNEFYGNHPELNKLLDADSQLRKDAIDFFDTIDYLYESGYGDWTDKVLEGLLDEYPFGYNLGKRNLIFHLKNKDKDGTTRVFYFPDRGVINIEGNAYIEIGGDSDKKANATFMEKYNNLEFDGSINHNGIDEVVADVTGSFFAQETEEFGSSEIEDSVRVSDMAVRYEEDIENKVRARNSDFVAENAWIYELTADPNAQVVQDAVDFFDTAEHLKKQGYRDWVQDTVEWLCGQCALGVDLNNRIIMIWGFSEKDNAAKTARMDYFPDKCQIRMDSRYAAIGADTNNEEIADFIKIFNKLVYNEKDTPSENIAWFTFNFFEMVKEEFGPSKIKDGNDVLAKWDDGVLAEQDDTSYIPEGYNYFWVCNNNEPLKHFTDYNDAVQFALGYDGTPICIEAYTSNGIGKKPTRTGIVWTNSEWDKQRG